MKDEGVVDPVRWTLEQLKTRLPSMVKLAGYEDIAARINQQAIADHLTRLEPEIIANSDRPCRGRESAQPYSGRFPFSLPKPGCRATTTNAVKNQCSTKKLAGAFNNGQALSSGYAQSFPMPAEPFGGSLSLELALSRPKTSLSVFLRTYFPFTHFLSIAQRSSALLQRT
jgi:hypothetical protein